MQLIFQEKPRAVYVLLCGIAETMPQSLDLARIIAKHKGFRWDPHACRWSTDSARIALSFAAFADDEVRQQIIKEAQTERDPTKALMVYERDRYIFYTPKVGYWEWSEAVKPNMKFKPLPEPHWWTEDDYAAATVYQAVTQNPKFRPNFIAGDGLHERLKGAVDKRAEAIDASRATDADIDIPCPPGLAFMPFQRAGVAFAMARRNTLFGDEMGLGKTIEALGTINADPDAKKILVVCPASLKLNWLREANKWLVPKDYDGKTRKPFVAVGESRRIPSSDVVIVNYEILGAKFQPTPKHPEGGKQLRHELREVVWDMLIVDEAHRCKTETTHRSKFTFAIKARRTLFLTGTPLPNRPRELWGIVHHLAPQTFSDKWKFLNRYCLGSASWGHQSYDGACNLDELQTLMRSTVMIRRLKSDVLKELPPKRRQVIEIPMSGYEHLISNERAQYDTIMREHAQTEKRREELKIRVELAKAGDKEDFEQACSELKAVKRKFPFEEIARIRMETAIAKIPHVIEHLEEVIAEQGKVVVFAHHKAIIQAIEKKFGLAAVTVYGETPMQGPRGNVRQKNVDRFQTDPECKLFIGGITAAGVGLTLTAASTCVMAELSWVPGDVTQCEDRLHRYGATGDRILIQHIVLEGSIDAKMIHTIIAKQEVADRALDLKPEDMQIDIDEVIADSDDEIHLPAQLAFSDTSAQTRMYLPENRSATHGVTQEQLQKKASELKPEDVFLIHHGLKRLATVCDGARNLDGAGFNSMDANVGRDLAGRAKLDVKGAALGWYILKKYQKTQLNGELDALYK